MVESTGEKKKKKGGTLSEEDVCYLLQRYQATTILAVLKEIAQYPSVKINWEVVLRNLNHSLATNNTTTINNINSTSSSSATAAIKTPRELQLLWRHLAYRLPLATPAENRSDQPADDDSDLEFEVLPFPPFTTEATTETANCVKVLACGSGNECSVPNNAPVEADMPNGHVKFSGPVKPAAEKPHTASVLPNNSNGTIPVAGHNDGLDGVNHPRKKRKWSEEEDLKLITGVQKWGEGNWAAMLKEDGNWGRTAGQLSQRWGNIKRKQGNAGVAGSTGVMLSEAQLATRRALNMALKDNLIAVGNGAAAATNKPAQPSASNGESLAVPNQKQPAQDTNTSVKSAAVSSVPKARPPQKKAAAKAPVVSDPIQLAAVAAGARIAKSTTIVIFNEKAAMFPNVHFIRTGLAATSTPVATGTASPANGGQQSKGNPGKPAVPLHAASHLPKAGSIPAASEQSNVPHSGSANKLKKQEDKTLTEVNAGDSVKKPMVGDRETNASLTSLPKALPEIGQSAAAGVSVGGTVSNSQLSTSKDISLNEHEDDLIVNPVPMDVDENSSAIRESLIENVDGTSELVTGLVVDSTEKEVPSNVSAQAG